MKNTVMAAWLAGATLLSASFGAAAAGTETPGVDQRQANQRGAWSGVWPPVS